MREKTLKPARSLVFPSCVCEREFRFVSFCFLGFSFAQDKSADYGHELNPACCIF